MTRALAFRLSRVLVGCYPRRWRQRYRDEMLGVLDQHRASGRTVLNLAIGALNTHLDPAYRLEGLQMNRLLRRLGVSAAVVVPIMALLAAVWAKSSQEDGHWHLGAGGSDSMAFATGRPVLAVAGSGPGDGAETLWDLSNPARPRKWSTFEGGAPTAFAPGGRMLSTISFGNEPVLWNVTNLAKPARIATLRVSDDTEMWGEAFSPNGDVFAAAYLDRMFLWDITDPARPKLVRTLTARQTPPALVGAVPDQLGDIAFSPDGQLLATVAGHDLIDLWDVADPALATRITSVPNRSGFADALAFSPRGDQLAVLSYRGTVTLYSLADPANPVATASMQTVTARQIAGTVCEPGGCAPDFSIGFSPDGRTLTAVADLAQPSRAQGNPPSVNRGPLAPRGYTFEWNVTNPRSVIPIGAFNHQITIAGDTSHPLVAPSGRDVVTGASNGFKISFWSLP
ncbi:MAG TPA: WD40 repeat domain-containing protein [Streptosporangiaceae bacterium]|nr:WD40 repeat domain-containing protein [Streptosporangiaceae bacterium]